MREAVTELWATDADLRIVTTNGFVKSNGEAVMGRGCAQEAKQRFPGIERRLGSLLNEHGNRPMRLRSDLATLPVKHNWWEDADPDLIIESVKRLVSLVDKFGYESVLMPRPGCGNGSLIWENIRPLIADLLDDRFIVIDKPTH
jgi:hypothetical protein